LDEDDDGFSASSVLARIEELMIQSVIEPLDKNEPPHNIGTTKSFYHLTHCRSSTSILMVASFCHYLLQANRTTTTREVYYFYVTHFHNQAECNKAIWDLKSQCLVESSTFRHVEGLVLWVSQAVQLRQKLDRQWPGTARP
jgi:DNA topoisomerase VI subunit A